MAEIKSTLDIIMERTKNLTMTDDEKASFRRKEAEGKVKGWIQRYQDGAIGLDKLRSDFEKEQAGYPEVHLVLKSQLIGFLKLGGGNEKFLELFEEVLGISADTIQNTIHSLEREIDVLRIERTHGLGEELKKRNIYGSAVIPNPDHDGGWQKCILEVESDLRKQLASLLNVEARPTD
jgi:hypothetical protein